MSDFDLRRSDQPGISEDPTTTTRWGFLVSTTLHAGILLLLTGFGAPVVLHAPESPVDVTFVAPENTSHGSQQPVATSKAEDAAAAAIPSPADEPVAQASRPQAIPDAVALPAQQPVTVKQPAAATHRPPPESMTAKPMEAKPAQARLSHVAQSSPPPSDAVAKTPPEQVKNEYAGLIQTLIVRNRIYPAEAQRARMEGTVAIRFLLMADGKVKKLAIAQGSGHDILDRAAKETIRRSSPFPPIPAAFKTDRIDMTLNLNYKLD